MPRLYDGASALAEACLMAIRANRAGHSRRVLVARSVNPIYTQVAQTIAGNQDIGFDFADFDAAGRVSPEALQPFGGKEYTALVIQQPNFFGNLEDVDALTDWAHANKMMVIAVVNPTSLGLLKPPGEWGAQLHGHLGADIVCGEGQPLGVPLSCGGPYFGFMATRMQYVRQMPGRIVGRTVDADGRPGFSLTLQAREQHIRRSKATSNICTNQGLMVTAATIYMSLLGAEGLEAVAQASLQRTADLLAPSSASRASSALLAERIFTRRCCFWTGPSRRCWRRWPAAASWAAWTSRSGFRSWAMRCWCARRKPNCPRTSRPMRTRSAKS
jgi:glycine dehydrogenase subunit 1